MPSFIGKKLELFLFFFIKCKNCINKKQAGNQQYIITISNQGEQTPLGEQKQAGLAEI